MKKLMIVLSVICAIAFGSAVYSYAYVPLTCSSVSGARVSGDYAMSNGRHKYKVMLRNDSGSRCSASFKVLGKTNGSWETIYEGILSADNNKSAVEWVDIEGYEAARLSDVSTWKCD